MQQLDNTPISELLRQQSKHIDSLLISIWKECGLNKQLDNQQDLCLIACGGYGRQEMHPYSDVDILILINHKKAKLELIEKFISKLWDKKYTVGHSINTVTDCVKLCADDVSTMTSYLEGRVIIGNENLYIQLQVELNNHKLWSPARFLQAKLAEQKQRHQKYGETSYNLEPNLKDGPGGLRDIQILQWLAKNYFHAQYLHQLIENGFLSKHEYQALKQGQNYLWRLRYALHETAGRKEDRILFDYQKSLAKLLNYHDDDKQLGVEHMMQDYYRNIKKINELSDMLLQLFQEKLLNQDNHIINLNKDFQLRNNHIETIDPDLFKNNPNAILDLFLYITPDMDGIRVETIRAIRRNRHLINKSFRENKSNQEKFISLFKNNKNIYFILDLMNRYGVLGNILPAFSKIIGKMQYDLFHLYTVDQHLLFVIKQIALFQDKASETSFPLCYKLFNQYQNKYILYLAALFHDISKGQGGDHSVLGASEIKQFSKQHELSIDDSKLLTWLVEEHLLMSTTAQKKDIYDKDVIIAFCSKIKNQTYLDSLYLLTVADINATSPSLWNSWKAQLLEKLYHIAKQELTVKTLSLTEQVQETKNLALDILTKNEIVHRAITEQWDNWTNKYFLRFTPEEIAWQANHMLKVDNLNDYEIAVKTVQDSVQLFIYCSAKPYVFACVTNAVGKLQGNITEADIFFTPDGFTIQTYAILNLDNDYDSIIKKISQPLVNYLSKDKLAKAPQKRMSRRMRHFSYPTKINFHQDKSRGRTIMELITPDRPGLLAKIGQAFIKHQVHLQSAKIVTMGERVEDVFFITDNQHAPIFQEDSLLSLAKDIKRSLDQAQAGSKS